MANDMVKVTQADREAAWPTRHMAYFTTERKVWDSGVYDKCACIQTYARHRIAAEQAVYARMRDLPDGVYPRIWDAIDVPDSMIAGRVDAEDVQLIATALADALEGQPAASQTLQWERDAFRTMAINHFWNHNLAAAYGKQDYQRQLEDQVDETLENMRATPEAEQ